MPRSKGDDEISGDDEPGLFRRLMADAKPLQRDTVPPPSRRARPKARFAREEQASARDSRTFVVQSGDSVVTEGLRYQHPSVSRHAMRRLARGGCTVQAAIDLHGMTSAEAQSALQEFFDEVSRRRLTCVRIVHGKGHGSGPRGPVLKRAIDHWLRHQEAVLAFVSARPSDGGTGAVYVLLRRTA